MKIWTVVAIAAVIWFLGLVTGSFDGRMMIGLLFLVVIGAIFPPLAIGMGSVVIVYLLLVKGQKVTAWITSKLGGKSS